MSQKPPAASPEAGKKATRPWSKLVVLWMFLALIAWVGINIMLKPGTAIAPAPITNVAPVVNTAPAMSTTQPITRTPTRATTPLPTPPRSPTR